MGWGLSQHAKGSAVTVHTVRLYRRSQVNMNRNVLLIKVMMEMEFSRLRSQLT